MARLLSKFKYIQTLRISWNHLYVRHLFVVAQIFIRIVCDDYFVNFWHRINLFQFLIICFPNKYVQIFGKFKFLPFVSFDLLGQHLLS